MRILIILLSIMLVGCGEFPTRTGLRDMYYADCRNSAIMDTYLTGLLSTSNDKDTKIIKDLLWRYRDDCTQPVAPPKPTYYAPNGQPVYYLNQDGSVMHW